jgi:hypothetical protein
MTWFVCAGIGEAIAINLTVAPPLSGLALFTAYASMYSFVLFGPFAFFFLDQFLFGESVFIIGAILGLIAALLLVLNRNRKAILNVVAGVLWCGSGSVALSYGIMFAV